MTIHLKGTVGSSAIQSCGAHRHSSVMGSLNRIGGRAEHNSVSVYRSNSILPHAPGLGLEILDQHRAFFGNDGVHLVDAVDFQIREIGVITQFLWKQCIRALASHDNTLVPHEYTPARVTEFAHLESKNVSIVSRRQLQLSHSVDFVSWASLLEEAEYSIRCRSLSSAASVAGRRLKMRPLVTSAIHDAR